MLTKNQLSNLYKSDYHQWLAPIIQLIDNRCFDELDYENLKEELADLDRSEKRANKG